MMAAEMAGAVGSALAQEGVSGVSSYISSKLEETASRAHMVARLEMSLSQLEFALERASKLPITYVSLLRRMNMLRTAFTDGTNLLNRHKLQELEDNDVSGQSLTRYPFLEWIGRAKNIPISSLLGFNHRGFLCSSVVQIFEWYATCADKFVADVESAACPLQGDTFRYPLGRQLLEGKTLGYEMAGGRQLQSLFVWPVRLEERGVEARLVYQYLHRENPGKHFCLRMVLRLSEDTDLVGIAIKCLQSISSQFKIETESAIGELTLLPHLKDISRSYGPPLEWTEETYAPLTKLWRPDPICCTNNKVISPHGVPEPVVAVGFGCYISAPDALGRGAPPLYLVAAFVPHHMSTAAAAPRGIVINYGGKEERLVGGSIQHVEQVVRAKAMGWVVCQPEPADYDVCWYTPHGYAGITLRKARDDLAWPKLARFMVRVLRFNYWSCLSNT